MRFGSSLWYAGVASAAALVSRDGDSLGSCPGYKASNVKATDSGLTADLSLAGAPCNAYGTDLKDLTLTVTYETDDRVHVKIQDKDNQVYQVPESVFPRPGGSSSANANKLKFDYTESPFSFKISRADSHEVLFDTSAASLVFESQYLRLRTSLPNDPNLYGLGEHSDPLRLTTDNYIRTMWNQDSYMLPQNSNLYGTHPFYLEHRATGSHGVFLLNSNGMDIMINKTTDGKQYLEYNTLGGVLDFWFVSGPSPIEAVQQYGKIAGTPAMQPYWGLGFHQCRYGYQDIFAVAEVVYNYSQAEIPLETMWTDIDYMDRRRVFTLDPDRFPLTKMRELVSYLHGHDQHYIVMVDPAVAYQDYPPLNQGVADDIFLRRDNGSLWLGVVWPGVTVFPDWFSKNIQQFWNGQFQSFFSKDNGVDIDALWIDMNEPSNFPCNFPCDNPYQAAQGFPPAPPPVRAPPRSLPGFPCDFQPAGTCKRSELEGRDAAPAIASMATLPRDASFDGLALPERRADGDQKGLPGRDLLYPKYAIHNKAAFQDSWNADKGGISNHTVNTDVHHQNGLTMYDTHNMYGYMMSLASREAMLSRRPTLRPMIITRSTFPGAGSKVGHWLGDNASTWEMYRNSIREMLAFTGIYQFAMVGSDTCGYAGDTTEELCARWAALGAFSPFYRNHNSDGSASQEFYLWKSVTSSARKAIDIRYRLLDYLYTAMRRANADGTPAVHPVFYLYPEDKATYALELEYFFGPGLLVAPVTSQGATSVQVYLPDDIFYDWYSHKPISGEAAMHTFIDQDTTTIPLLIRGGVILPARANSTYTTAKLRDQDFELLIPVDAHGTAKGELYLDDGVSIDVDGRYSLVTFTYEDGVLSFDGVFDYSGEATISKITLLGTGCKPRPGKREHTTGGSKMYSKTIDVHVPLNKAGTVKAS
ncbi:putative alpha/beta-glucosidase agdC [Tolypocladium ophioglossoides CBS 100239]|uniref:Putative alpha/beta-glucosidase agdC n=1 Tax=Tolypocladium ophioglossoides (strain CBS 100239) TaxID=1163406 RepID=A0A0L0N0V4_TOLOC|nr:putative alpha/beta-glucosidase agdC [Tolypocladium ophioglossoides CBS 100239]